MWHALFFFAIVKTVTFISRLHYTLCIHLRVQKTSPKVTTNFTLAMQQLLSHPQGIPHLEGSGEMPGLQVLKDVSFLI